MSESFVTGRGVVNAWECDQWGHLNVQFYLAKASDALAVMAAQSGLKPSQERQSGLGLLPVSDRILFKRELRAGDIYTFRSGIRAIEVHGALAVASTLINLDTGAEAATFETQLRWAELDSGELLPCPDEVRLAASAVWIAQAPPPRPAAHAHPTDHGSDHLLLTYRGSVESWECDARGMAPPRAHIARFAECVNHLFLAMGVSKSDMRERRLGSAALDYDIDYRRPMRVGQAVEVRSGVLAAGEKVFHFFHRLIDSASGEVLTSIVVAALFFDLDARKSVPIPDAVRSAAQLLVALPHPRPAGTAAIRRS